jgi:hypothetical protein
MANASFPTASVDKRVPALEAIRRDGSGYAGTRAPA